MGNRSKDENAATSTDARDRDQESRDAALARTIAMAVAGALKQQKAKETVHHGGSSPADQVHR